MPCLAHNARFRSSFHAVVNELRDEQRTPTNTLRSIPRKCCTCKNDNKIKVESIVVIRSEENDLVKLKNLVDRVNGENQKDLELIESLHRLIEIIQEQRGLPPPPPEPVVEKIKNKRDRRPFQNSSDSDPSDDDGSEPMETSKRATKGKKKVNTNKNKPPKPVKDGILVFLPYSTAAKATNKKNSDALTDTAKTLRRGKFIGRKSDIKRLEREHHVRINMILTNTSEQLKTALENATNGLNNLTLYNLKGTPTEVPSDKKSEEGEWLLVRSKPKEKKTKEDLEPLLIELIQRWECTLMINKRKRGEEE